MQTQTQRFPLATTHVFAGLNFPHVLAILPKGKPATRLVRRRAAGGPSFCGPTYILGSAPVGPDRQAFGGYLEEDNCLGLRFKWADEVEGVRIEHTGWFTDEEQVGETMRGIVARLPRSRGFLAGWSMGEGMSTTLESEIFDDEADAARRADSFAQESAEAECEYQAAHREEEEEEPQEEEAPPAPILGFDGFGFNDLADEYRSRVLTLAKEYKPGGAKEAQGAAIMAALFATGVMTDKY